MRAFRDVEVVLDVHRPETEKDNISATFKTDLPPTAAENAYQVS